MFCLAVAAGTAGSRLSLPFDLLQKSSLNPTVCLAPGPEGKMSSLEFFSRKISWAVRVGLGPRWTSPAWEGAWMGHSFHRVVLASWHSLVESVPPDPMDGSPPGFSVQGILQARILERVAISSSRGSSQPRDRAYNFCISCAAGLHRPSHRVGAQQMHSLEF